MYRAELKFLSITDTITAYDLLKNTMLIKAPVGEETKQLNQHTVHKHGTLAKRYEPETKTY